MTAMCPGMFAVKEWGVNETDILDRLEDEAKEEVERSEAELRSLLEDQKRDAEQLLERERGVYSLWSSLVPAAMLERERAKYKAWKTVLHRIKQLRRLAAAKNAQTS